MIRTILKSTKNSLTLQLPDDLVGKTIEVIAFSIDDNTSITKEDAAITTGIEAFRNKIKNFAFNSGGYKFDRDDANDYE
jgi:hypothetical protein